ncbi:hypothetical protein PCASD_05536 [Puccinia coronata f. sp. avenae]|uniref:Uncharacterized protein n=1 Tax=Puccinia coronata f. sp. avenae TaxID=200324 RepID=A0A2N5UVL8_9BASI|nr:hypothetical protein PCASD_05536 [Puccinia coronata f. sp. avenae]
MDEDSSSKYGVDRSLCFAALLELGSTEDKSFKTTMTLMSKSRREFPVKLWTSPRTWELTYDGITQLGRLELHLSTNLPSSEENERINDQVIWISSVFSLIILCCGLIFSSTKTS